MLEAYLFHLYGPLEYLMTVLVYAEDLEVFIRYKKWWSFPVVFDIGNLLNLLDLMSWFQPFKRGTPWGTEVEREKSRASNTILN